MGLFLAVPFMDLKGHSSIGKDFKGLFVCFPAQGKLFGQNIVWNFYPSVNDLFNKFLKVDLFK